MLISIHANPRCLHRRHPRSIFDAFLGTCLCRQAGTDNSDTSYRGLKVFLFIVQNSTPVKENTAWLSSKKSVYLWEKITE